MKSNVSMNKYDNIISWFHPDISREDAEQLLLNDPRNINGLFLVRASHSSLGDFVLSVLCNNHVGHFQIRRHREDAFFSIDERLKFHGLESLIDYYSEEDNKLPENIVLREFVKGKPPPHDARRHGNTNLLHRATTHRDYKVVMELLKTGYSHETKNQDGRTAVHIASMFGENEILCELISYGANVNVRDTAGYTPLHYACQNNFPATVRLLVRIAGANIQARNTESGEVPLHEAASRGHIEVVKELLSLNAPVNPRTKENLVPAQLARKNNHTECATILEKYECPATKTVRTSWYHGTLGRQEAEAIIKQYSRKCGTFLVRLSERNKEHVLTLLFEENFYNYIIRAKGNHLFIDDGPYLDSLEHIIEYYSFIPDGLPTVLLNPVPPKPKPPVPAISILSTLRKRKNLVVRATPENKSSEEYDSTKCTPNLNVFENITFTGDFNILNNNNVENEDEYIPPERIKLGEGIGEGEFASVYKGTYVNKSGEMIPVAIKTLRNEQVETNKGAFLTEAQVMMKLNHHCIVKLIGLSIGPPLLMVQELVPLGSILQYIESNREIINPNYEFKIWAAQVACGMQYLEENRFVHRDLAARNILLASQVQAKISDFGLSRALGTDHEYYRALKGGKWPLKWYAPESYNYGQFSHKSDVWSFGITIWEMYSFGEVPYGDMKGAEAIVLINNGERLPQPEACPDQVFEIMKKCWEFEAQNRPNFIDLVDFFRSDSAYMNLRELLPESDLA